jgi:hypothetical protein
MRLKHFRIEFLNINVNTYKNPFSPKLKKKDSIKLSIEQPSKPQFPNSQLWVIFIHVLSKAEKMEVLNGKANTLTRCMLNILSKHFILKLLIFTRDKLISGNKTWIATNIFKKLINSWKKKIKTAMNFT